MYVVLTTIYPDNPSIRDWLGIGEAIRSQFGVTLIALVNTAVFLWAFAQLRPAARADARGGAGARARAATPGTRQAGTGPGGDRCARRSAEAAWHGRGRRRGRHGGGARAGRRPRRRLVPAWFDRPSWSDVGPIAWFRARIDETPIRPDRSATLSPRGPRPPRPPRPVAPDRAGRRRDGPAHVPARRAGADALRRGLPRADGRRVPPGLAVRHLALHLRVDAPAPRQVRDGRRHRPVRRPRHAGDQRPRRAGPRRGHRAPPAGPVIHDAPATATASGSRPARR